MWNAPDAVAYAEKKLGITLDDWQKEYIAHEGNTVVRAGRQSGKSFAESLRVALFALLNPKTSTLIIASVDRQSIELLEKVKAQIMGLAKAQIKGTPTFHKIELKNGSIIRAEPAGQTGYGLRGFTVDKLVADEAHYIPNAVFIAVRPMLATTGGTIDLLSTPKGNEGYFYDCCDPEHELSEEFFQIHVTTKEVYSQRLAWTKEWREGRLTWLGTEKKTLTKLQFAQEYEAVFLDALQQFYPLKLIESCYLEDRLVNARNTLGVDFAGHGGDPNAFVNWEFTRKMAYIYGNETTEDQKAWETIQKIIRLNEQHNYIRKGIGVDSGGLGSPILDYLLLENALKRKVVGLDNASKDIDAEGKTKQLKGIEMHCWLKLGMEQGIVKFSKDNEELIRAFMSVQYEVDKVTKRITIHGRFDHLIEAAKRGYWCIKSKQLNILAFC